jgi:membrane-anchored mycosin MYCP
MRRISTPTRLVAVLGAGLLAALGPGAAAAQPSSVPPPSAGKPSSSVPPVQDGFAKPPPLPPGFPVPTDPGGPDLPYEQKTLCVKSLNETVDLLNKPWGQNVLRFDELHKFATGKNQTVAVIDTGVNPHAFLGNRLSGGGDYVAPNNGLQDCDGHGTEVAGIIAANPTKPDVGFKGIAPEAKILSIRQSSANYSGKDKNDPNAQERTAGNLLTLAYAVVRAANSGAGVINMSVDNCRQAGPITAPELQLQSALRFAVEDKNVVVVASAGNLNENGCPNQNNGPDANRPTTIVTPPWFSDYVLSVAAMDRNGDPAGFSVQGPWVSVAAPGTEIISLDPGNPEGLANLLLTKDNKRSQIQGTSFAAPYVAGLAALVRDRFPQLSAKQVMNRIKVTASHPAATGGRDSLVGHGMINPIGALTAMIPAEQGIAADKATTIEFDIPPPVEKNWTPMRVAIIGSTGGVALLLTTLFLVHTVRTVRRRRQPPTDRPLHGWE